MSKNKVRIQETERWMKNRVALGARRTRRAPETMVQFLLRHSALAALAILLAMAIVGSLQALQAQTTNQTTGQTIAQGGDGQVEMAVVHALDGNSQLKNDWITAGTVHGVVTLSGTSASDANRALAEQIAGQVPGVSKVVNNLKVGAPQVADNSAGQANGAADDQPMMDDGQPVNGPENGQPMTNGQQMTPQQGYGNDNRPNYQNGQDSNGQYPNGQYAQQPGQPMQPGQPGQPGQPPQYAQQQQYGQPQDGQQQYGQQYGQQQQYQQPQQYDQPVGPEPMRRPVTIEPGALLKVRTAEALSSRQAQPGQPMEFTVMRDVYARGILAIPRGATVRGQVMDVRQPGALTGSPELALTLTSVEMGGQSYPLNVEPYLMRGPGKGGQTAEHAFGGALLGALIGGMVGGGGGAAIGAVAGGATGTAATAASHGPNVWVPAEAELDFHLDQPVTLMPVSRAEAQRLAMGVRPEQQQQRPSLYRRGFYGGGYGGAYGYPGSPYYGGYMPGPSLGIYMGYPY